MAKRILKRVIHETKRFVLPSNDPGVFIIGAQKSGTSSLHCCLVQHPDIKSGAHKEVGYFHRDIYFGKTRADYKKDFLGSRSKIYLDSTPEYLIHPHVPKNIHDAYPNTKMIALLRDPVNRAYSAWNHYRQHFESGRFIKAIKNKPRLEGNLLYDKFFNGRDIFPSFRECIEIEMDLISKGEGFEPALLRRGLYLDQLEHYWRYFDKEQIMIIGFKDFISDIPSALNNITKFVGAKEISWDHLSTEPKNQRDYSEFMKDDDKAFLKSFFAEPNQRLFNILGHFNW